ncbi:MAG: hypothetical protein IPP33_05840 [Flavobacteriales bacterium]|nr:hypothetical protein [Flavobacteriales bacterium]
MPDLRPGKIIEAVCLLVHMVEDVIDEAHRSGRNVYQAGTLSGNPVAMAAGLAQVSECAKGGFYMELERKTASLCNSVNAHAKSKGMTIIDHLSSDLLGLLRRGEHPTRRCDRPGQHEELCETACSTAGAWRLRSASGYEVGFISTAHTDEHIARVADTFCSALDEVMITFPATCIRGRRTSTPSNKRP